MVSYRWLIAALIAWSTFMTPAIAADGPPQQLIVKWSEKLPAQQRDAITAKTLNEAGARHGISLQYLRTGGTGANVYKLSRALSRSELDDLIKTLTADPNVEYAEPDSVMRPMPRS